MAVIVCCPCGNPLDCDQIELVVTLNCPRCSRELTLELEHSDHQRRYAILTVMEGPFWVGEQFVMPVGEKLVLGTDAGNWLSLEGDELAGKHCHLELSPEGLVTIEGNSERAAVWIGESCVVKARLRPAESFAIGEYRFRLDLRDPGGAESDPSSAAATAAPRHALPALRGIGRSKTPGEWIMRRRFLLSRCMMTAFAGSAALHHVFYLRFQPADPWEWRWALVTSLLVLVSLLLSGRYIAMDRRYGRYTSLAALVILAAVNTVWNMPISAIAALVVASALTLVIARLPSAAVAMFAGLVGIAGLAMMVVLAIRDVVESALR